MNSRMGGARGTAGEDRGVRVNGGGGGRLGIAPRAFPRQGFRAGEVDFGVWDTIPFGNERRIVEGVGVRVSGLDKQASYRENSFVTGPEDCPV